MRANILCAGFGTRLRPFTYLKPKPLLVIGGQPLVERTIRLLKADGVDDIALVVGYKHESFEYLVEKYGVQLIVSGQYATANNFSSLQLVAHRLGNSFVIDGDTYIRRPVVPLLRPGVSQFICQKTLQGLEWELVTDADGRVLEVRKDSPSGYSMSGVSWWTEEAAALLRQELDRSGPDDYWEDSVIRILDKVPVHATPVDMLLCEIDSLQDARALGLLTADEVADQCSETMMAEKVAAGEDDVYHIRQEGRPLVLRIPGQERAGRISSGQETFMTSLAQAAGLTPESRFYAGGIMTRALLADALPLEEAVPVEQVPSLLADALHRLHGIPVPAGHAEGSRPSLLAGMQAAERQAGTAFLAADERELLYGFAAEMDEDAPCFCHGDCSPGRILYQEGGCLFIDFMHACVGSPYWDHAVAALTFGFDGNQLATFCRRAGGDEGRLCRAMAVVAYMRALRAFGDGRAREARHWLAGMDAQLLCLGAVRG